MLSQSNFKSHKLQGIRCCSLPVLFYMQQKSVFWGYLCSYLLNSNRFFHSAWTQIFTESTVTIWTLKMFNGLKRHVFSCFLQMLQEENIFFSWMLKTWDLSFHSKKISYHKKGIYKVSFVHVLLNCEVSSFISFTSFFKWIIFSLMEIISITVGITNVAIEWFLFGLDWWMCKYHPIFFEKSDEKITHWCFVPSWTDWKFSLHV